MYKVNFRNHKYFVDLAVIGEQCKYYRKKILKMTTYEMAKEIGCSQATISLFENGGTNHAYVLLGYIKRGFMPR